MEIINKNISALNDLCSKHKVSRLYIFGSVLGKDFREKSDIDLVVYFLPGLALLEYADNFFDFIEALEQLFERKIDLVSGKAVKNPYFAEELQKTQKLIYEKKAA